MYPIDMQQLNQLIHEVVSTYVWQFLAKVMNYDQQTCKPDITAQWDSLTNDLTRDIGSNLRSYFGDITTAAEAEHRLDDILTLVSNELANRTAVSETDRNIGKATSWDHWIERMQEDNWGQPEGWYFNGEHYADDLDEFLRQWFQKHYTEIHDATVELRRAGEPPQRWTYTAFVNYFAALPQDTYVPHRVEYQRPDDIDDWHPLPPPYTADHLNIISALYEKNRFVSLYARMKSWRVRVEPIED